MKRLKKKEDDMKLSKFLEKQMKEKEAKRAYMKKQKEKEHQQIINELKLFHKQSKNQEIIKELWAKDYSKHNKMKLDQINQENRNLIKSKREGIEVNQSQSK